MAGVLGLEGEKCAHCSGRPWSGILVPVYGLIFHYRLQRGACDPGQWVRPSDCFRDGHVSQVSPMGISLGAFAGTIKKGSTGAAQLAGLRPGTG